MRRYFLTRKFNECGREIVYGFDKLYNTLEPMTDISRKFILEEFKGNKKYFSCGSMKVIFSRPEITEIKMQKEIKNKKLKINFLDEIKEK